MISITLVVSGLYLMCSFLSSLCCPVMFHGPPATKIKRELTPSKELSPCHQDRSPIPYAEKCLYSYRYKKIKDI